MAQKKITSAIFTIPQSLLITAPNGTYGWVSQQVLKLKVAQLVASKHYVVLDAKNHFINTLCESDFFDENKPRLAVTSNVAHKERLMGKSFKSVFDFFGLDGSAYLERSVCPSTPFIFDNQIVQDLITEVETRLERPFADAFIIDIPDCTEFFLYNAYLIWRDGSLDKVHSVQRNLGNGLTIWGDDIAADPTYFSRVMDPVKLNKAITFAVHKSAINKLSQSEKQAISNFWFRRGLLNSGEETQFLAG